MNPANPENPENPENPANFDRWLAFWATMSGWILDAFDYNILAIILLDIQKSFTVDSVLAGALATVTLVMRLIGGVTAGAAADRYGRKLPLMLSILWFSLFAFLSGFSKSYTMLFALRALFGIGMGGMWAAGMPLVIEHTPAKKRGMVSGLLLGGWYWGYLLAAGAFQYIYPIFNTKPDTAWRAMFWIAIVPGLLTLWLVGRVKESPVWLERQRQLQANPAAFAAEPKFSLVRIFQRDLIWTTVQTTAVIGAFMCSFYSIGTWYATLLRLDGRVPLPYLVAFNLGAIGGTATWGRISEGRLGRRGATTITALLGVASIPLYLHTTNPTLLGVGAFMMGAFGCGIWGMAPAYVTERYPTEARGVGPGFCYHAAAAIGSLMPIAIGSMRDHGMALANAMSIPIAIALACSAAFVWLGPETRGKQLTQ